MFKTFQRMYDSRVEYLDFGCLNRWTLGKYLKLLLTYHPVLLNSTSRLIIDHIQKLKLLNHTHWFGEQDLMSSVVMIVQILKNFIQTHAVDIRQTLYIKPFELQNQASPPGCVTIGLQSYRHIGPQSHLTVFTRQEHSETYSAYFCFMT